MFDEIFTGFRYPGGSVQQAIGIAPDLTCFGKALSSGAPLGAVVGRRDVFDRTAHSIRYHPTFKGEVCAFASALEALEIYREQDVAGGVTRFGERLAIGVTQAAQEAGIRGCMTGLPFRLVFRFEESDTAQRAYLRTLLEQQLLAHGIFTFRGFLLPSFAHDEQVLQQTIAAYRSALSAIAKGLASADIISRLELPAIR